MLTLFTELYHIMKTLNVDSKTYCMNELLQSIR